MAGTGGTSYSTGCRLVGEGDLYGIGVRLSYYLFFFATLIATLQYRFFSSSSHKTPRTGPLGKCASAINILTFALLVVLIRNTLHGSFAALEWALTFPSILVTFISLCFALPVLDNAGVLLCYAFTLTLFGICQPWLYFGRIYQGRKGGCEVQYWFFGARIFFGDTWTKFFRTMSVVGCIGTIVFFLGALGYAIRKLGLKVVMQLQPRPEKEKPTVKGGNLEIFWKSVGMVLLFFAGIVAMTMVENTIALNDIDLSDTPLGSTSQLIPFLTGLLSFLSTLYSCVKTPAMDMINMSLGLPTGRKEDSSEPLLPGWPGSGSGTQVHETV